jgi:hypothetical protein
LKIYLPTLYVRERYRVSWILDFVLKLFLNISLDLRILSWKEGIGLSLEFLLEKYGVAEVRDREGNRETEKEKCYWWVTETVRLDSKQVQNFQLFVTVSSP